MRNISLQKCHFLMQSVNGFYGGRKLEVDHENLRVKQSLLILSVFATFIIFILTEYVVLQSQQYL